MKLTTRLALNLSIIVFSVLVVWAASLYYVIVFEISSETQYEYSVLEGDFEDLDDIRDGEYRAGEYVDEILVDKEELKEEILFWIVILYVILLVVVVGLSYIVIRRSFRPLYRLLDWLEDFDIDHNFTKPDISLRTEEFLKLRDAVSASWLRSREAYDRQKSFVGNASHELQTPLAICMNRLELLCDDDSLSEAQLGEVLATKRTLEQAIRLNKALLLQTKIDNNFFKDQREISVGELAQQLLEEYEQIYSGRHISVNIVQESPMILKINDTLARILVGNLLRNAFIHNIDGGKIDILIRHDKFSVSNSGSATTLDSSKIFDRFYQGSKREGSTGLGLSMAHSIAQQYSLDLRYHFSDGLHFFEVIVL